MHPLHHHIQSQVSMSEENFEKLLKIFVPTDYSKGQTIIKPNNSITHQYFVLSGCLRTYLIDAKGKEHTLQFAIENWWVSDYIAYYNSEPAIFHVECLEDSHLLKVNKSALTALFDEMPLVERFFRRQLENAFVAFQKRILTNLNNTAEERYRMFTERYPDIENRVKNYQIASYLGITPESLSRLRSQKTKSNT